jgi:hypothetical protein
MRATDESSEEISATGGENAVVIFRSDVFRRRKMMVLALRQTSQLRREAVCLFAFNRRDQPIASQR